MSAMECHWMYGKPNALEHFDGFKELFRQATEYQRRTADDKMYCPCCDYWIMRINDIQQEESDGSSPLTCESMVGVEDNDVEEDKMDDIMTVVGDNLNEQSNKRGKGPSKGVQVKEPMFLEYDDLGQPMGDWQHEYRKQLGACALKININVKEYQLVPEGDKQTFWNETKALFHIEDGPKKEKERLFHSGVARRFNDFKAKLVRRWISKTRKPPKDSAHLMPWEVYKGFITQEDWKKFEADYATDEAKANSERARKNAKQYKDYRHLGQKCYKRSREQWIKDGICTTDAEKTSTCKIGKRGLKCLLAREVPGQGGTLVIPNDETQNVAEKNEDYMQQQTQDTAVLQQNVDALALGEKDDSGCEYGVPDRKHTRLNLSREIKAEIIASEMEKLNQKLDHVIDMAIKKKVPLMMQALMRGLTGLKVPQISNLIQTTQLPPMLKEAMRGNHIEESKDNFVDKSGASTSHAEEPLQQIEENILASVGKESKLLRNLMKNQPEGYDVRTVQLDANAFHFKKEVETFVTTEDITKLLNGEGLSIPVVQVFMMFLIDEFINPFDLSQVGFLCPKKVSAYNIRRHYKTATNYMRDVFLSIRDKGELGYKLILAPYLEGEHWMLIVINPICGKVFVFDSSMSNKGKSLMIKNSLDLAYSIYKVQGGERHITKLKWIPIKCAQQTGGTESGYYVMRFMHEMVTIHNSCQALEKNYPEGNEPYSDKAIDEIREQWAAYFRNKYL